MQKLTKVIMASALCLSLAGCSLKKEVSDTMNGDNLVITDESVVSSIQSQTRTVVFDTEYLAGDVEGSPIISGSIVPVGSTFNIYPIDEFSQVVSIEINGMIYAGNTATYTVAEGDPAEIKIIANFADMEEPAVAASTDVVTTEPVSEPAANPEMYPVTGEDIPEVLKIGGFRFAQPSNRTSSAYLAGMSYECSLTEESDRNLRVTQYSESADGMYPYHASDYGDFADFIKDVASYELGSRENFNSTVAEVGGQPAMFVTVNSSEGSCAVMYIKSPDGSDSTFARFSYTTADASASSEDLTNQLIAIISDIRLSI